MTDQKVLIFGSFTEDEIKSLYTQPAKNDAEITFGTLDLETLRSVGILGTKLIEPAFLKGCKPSQLRNKEDAINTPYNFDNASPFVATSTGVNGTTNNNITACYIIDKKLKSSRVDYSKGGAGSDLSHLNSLQTHARDSPTELSAQLNGLHLINSSEGTYEENSEGSISSATNGPLTAARNLIPRGLVNMGNLCFLNATLQALLSCFPFIQLLLELRTRHIPKEGYPTLRAFVEFISDFDIPPDTQSNRRDMIVPVPGKPFRPVMFESILKSFTPDVPDSLSGRPRQEDAQEFLSFVMHQMHDELLKLDGQIAKVSQGNTSLISSLNAENDNDDWETVGPKNRSAVTRTQSFVPSQLSAIFGGQLRSVVKTRGNKASATIEPFLLLHLNICPEPVSTVEDALRLFSAQETLEGYKTPAAGKAEYVSASKSVKIQELSNIMVLHLMRFSYGCEGSTKLHKPVHFPLELVLGRELLVSPTPEGRRYELVATITHHGRDPSKGHYTADARHLNGSWLHYDDASVTPISTSEIMHDQAYILFYRQL